MSQAWFGRGRALDRKQRTPKSWSKHRRILGIESLEDRLYLSASPVPVAVPDDVAFHPANSAAPLDTSGPMGMTPAEIDQAYGISVASGNGAGTTIAIVDAYNDPTIAGDLQKFDAQFGLANPVLTVENQTGGTSLPAANASWSTEIALDVEWSHAVAPGANILLIEANSSSMSDLMTAVNTARNAPSVVAVSMSWGGSEFSGETSYDSDFTTPAGHIGVSFFVSSGDDGAPISYPAASPNVVSVGGTTLDLSGSSYGSESAWSGSGGGISQYETQPSYQKGVVTQSTTARTNPDVAYDADPNTGFPVYNSYANGTKDPWGQWGGTSDAAPQWAGLVAIADQQREAAGLGSLNGATQLLPALYQLPASDFHDVTTGSSTGSPHEAAGSGYDLATGRGTPVGNLLIAALSTYSGSSGGGGTTTAPAAPANFSAQATSSTQVSVSWSLSTGATSYSVYSEIGGGQPVLDGSYSASTTSATIGNLTAGDTYSFQVVAINSAGSAATAWKAVTLPAAALSAPGNFSVQATSSTQAALSWTESSGATGYSVYTQSGGKAVLLGTYSASTTSVSVNNLAAGSTYSFQVVATNATNSAATAWVSVTMPSSGSLAAPQNFSVTASSSTVAQLSWNASAGASGYAVFWWNGKAATELGQVNSRTTSVSVSGLAPGSTDKFYITAFSASSSASTAWVSVTMPAAAVLAAPTNVTATATSSTTGLLSWTASAGAQGYTIYWQNGNQLVDLGSVGANTTSVSLQGLPAGSTNDFVIVAFNGSRTAASSEVALTTPAKTSPSQLAQASRLADAVFSYFAADRRWNS
jgi:hypothetical protein